MWPKSFGILVICVILHVDCFPINNVVKKKNLSLAEILNDLDDDDNSAELYSGHFQGDMILSREQMEAIGNKNGMLDKKYFWTDGIVPFLFEKSHFDDGQADYILTAMKKIENVSCVRFVPYNPKIHVDYVHVKGNEEGCFSEVGCQHSASQRFNIQNTYKLEKGCFHLFSIVHELLHALGFHHMHAASDRDNYIRINEQNIMTGFKDNFARLPASFITHFGVEYDYGSVMHYSNTAFSFDHHSLTIEPKRYLKDVKMGQRDHMTEKDILRLNRAYECNHTKTTTTTTKTTTTTTKSDDNEATSDNNEATSDNNEATSDDNEVTTVSMATNQPTNSFINNFMNSMFSSKILKTVLWNILGFIAVAHLIYKIN